MTHKRDDLQPGDKSGNKDKIGNNTSGGNSTKIQDELGPAACGDQSSDELGPAACGEQSSED